MTLQDPIARARAYIAAASSAETTEECIACVEYARAERAAIAGDPLPPHDLRALHTCATEAS